MTKMAALARELHDLLDELPLHTKNLSGMFRKHGDKNQRSSHDIDSLDNRLARYGRHLLESKRRGEELPNPADYLPERYIRQHMDQFGDGVSRFQSLDGYRNYSPFRTDGDGTSFVLPSADVSRIVDKAAGDIRVVEQELGLPRGTFGDGPIVVVDFPNATPHHLDMPSGNETGANDQWVPFGGTEGGVPEAVLHDHSPGAVGHHARTDAAGDIVRIGGQ